MAYLYTGTIVQMREDGAMVQVPAFGPNHNFGPMEVGAYDLQTGDHVLVGQVGNTMENLVVVSRLEPSLSVGGLNHVFIWYFETIAARNVVFDGVPAHMLSPTFAWVDDTKTLYVWTDEDNAWHQVSWDETRITTIEAALVSLDSRLDTAEATITSQGSTISSHTGTLTSYGTRLTGLEGMTVTDSATIDFTITGTPPAARDITASVKTNSISIDSLSDVSAGAPANGQHLRYNGGVPQWQSDYPLLDDNSDVDLTGLANGHVIYWDSTAGVWKPTVPPGTIISENTNNSTARTASALNGAETICLSLTFTAEATTTKYTYTYEAAIAGSVTLIGRLRVRVQSGSSVTSGGGTQLRIRTIVPISGEGKNYAISATATGLTAGGQYTMAATVQLVGSTSGTITVAGNSTDDEYARIVKTGI